MELSIIIINYKTSDLTLQAVRSARMHVKLADSEIIVIDNHSDNGDAERLERELADMDGIRFLANSDNVGFSKANNQGIRMATGEYIVLLNSDTLLKTDSPDRAVRYLQQNPNVGAVGCRLITPDGKLDHGCKRGFPTPEASLYYFLKLHKFFKSPRFDAYMLSNLDEHTVHNVDVISGAFMVMPRKVLDEVGLLDELFFMYGEDIDLCFRIRQAGYRVVYNPELGDVIHYKGSSGKKRKLKTLINFHQAMILFYNKHYRHRYPWLVTGLVYAGVSILFLFKGIWNMFKT